ncbi:hypothetical protein B0T24DRAFT_684499 [Lasiosphaeria ovina]|uniref:Uncharacterized protein n=1 Tax=Lasiosphaeria ovina TaxID=92902 RepID=A0AAE0JTC6_9PEZI|nr:hypothetical protein B0T24DRAFT_684499 [Lasiosphaeria ovina]
MPTVEPNEASAPPNKASKSNEDQMQETVHILPTKYFRDIDSLVKILQGLVGKKGTFEIEMQNTSYIIKSPDRIELKDLVDSIAQQRRSSSVPDLNALRISATQHRHRHGVDPGLVAGSSRQSLEETGASA